MLPTLEVHPFNILSYIVDIVIYSIRHTDNSTLCLQKPLLVIEGCKQFWTIFLADESKNFNMFFFLSTAFLKKINTLPREMISFHKIPCLPINKAVSFYRKKVSLKAKSFPQGESKFFNSCSHLKNRFRYQIVASLWKMAAIHCMFILSPLFYYWYFVYTKLSQSGMGAETCIPRETHLKTTKSRHDMTGAETCMTDNHWINTWQWPQIWRLGVVTERFLTSLQEYFVDVTF